MTPKQASDSTDNLEAKLSDDLKHTLKLVPQSQRELFVFELARYITERDKKRDAYIIGENEAEAEIGTRTRDNAWDIRRNQLRAEQRTRSEEEIWSKPTEYGAGI